MKRPRSIFKTVIVPIVVTIAIVPTFAIALWELLHGRGAATYTNVFGLTIHYTSLLVLVLALVLTLGVAYIARIAHFWCNGHDRAATLRKIDSLGSSFDSSGNK
jgi:hypothetical protein